MHTGAPAVIPTQAHVEVVQVHMIHAVSLQLIVMPRQRQVLQVVPALHMVHYVCLTRAAMPSSLSRVLVAMTCYDVLPNQVCCKTASTSI